jgi:hypothetical protein
MLEPDFELPDLEVSKAETQKRLKLLDWFTEYIRSSVTGLIASGSMSYGQNYSVKPSSDIDMQLLVTDSTVEELAKTDCFDPEELRTAISGYKKGLFKQFSLVFHKDGVPMECHFWDEQAFIEAATFKAENTKRLRTSINTPSTDHGFSFDREENTKDYYGEMVDGYAVADFPSYRKVNGKIFLCRPITNVFGIPLVKITSDKLNDAFDASWLAAVDELLLFAAGKPIDLDSISIANTLPGKNKMSPGALANVRAKTRSVLDSLESK